MRHLARRQAARSSSQGIPACVQIARSVDLLMVGWAGNETKTEGLKGADDLRLRCVYREDELGHVADLTGSAERGEASVYLPISPQP